MRAQITKLVCLALVLAFAVTHVIAVYTETINWDELVLLQRAERTIATGYLHASGRPGLGTIALLPVAHECTSSVDAVHAARLVWCAITFALVGGLFVLLRRTTRSWQAAALGTALVVLVPVFLRWSVHVRTDQPAIACALWGGVALLASRRRPAWGVLAGALFATGYLFSQKAVYVTALVGLVALGELYVEDRVVLRRDALRVTTMIAGGVAVLALYKLVVPLFYTPPPTVTIGKGLTQFEFYRAALGMRVYKAMLPTVVPLLAALALVVAAAVVAMRRAAPERKRLLVAIGAATLGVVVGRFHAAAFPYFWMTLGLFFGAAIALAWPAIESLWPKPARVASLVLVAGALVTAIRTLPTSLYDAQAIQRDMLGFVEKHVPESQRSFHPHGAWFCRNDPDPMPAMLNESTLHRFANPAGIADFIAEFRRRQIAVVLVPNQIVGFPPAVHEFWDANYQRYYGSVRLAGRRITSSGPIEIIVPGTYRWHTRDGADVRITVDGTPLARGATIALAAGMHVVEVQGAGEGMLVLAVDAPPNVYDTLFYSDRADQRYHAERAKRYPPPRY